MDCLKLKGTQSTRNVLWSERTIEKSLQLRCAIGKRGYEYLRGQDFPFPSHRNLCRKTEGMLFQEGIHFEFLDGLKYKLQESKRDCVLLLDEMQICEKIAYDASLKMFTGIISKDMEDDDADKLAFHVLIFMLRGVRRNWKQPVAHYLKGPSINGKKLASVIENIIRETHSGGINVLAVISDVGYNNRSIWSVFGVHSIRNHVYKTVTHPSDPLRKMYFLPDVSHTLKNVRNCLLKQDIILPDAVVAENSLPSNRVSLSHIKKLIDLKKDHQLKLSCKLKQMHTQPSRFELMKVFPAAQILSHSTSASLHFCVLKNLLPESVLATAWFCDFVNNWYDVMNARLIKDALRPTSTEAVRKLEEMLSLIGSIKYCPRNVQNPRAVQTWKPIQAGIQLATSTVLQLLEELCITGKYQYLLTARLNQDALENLFSQLRNKGDSHPDAVHIRRMLKLISISKFFDNTHKKGSYSVDDACYIGCLTKCKDICMHNSTSSHACESILNEDESFETREDMSIVNREEIVLDKMEEAALHYIGGYIVKVALKKFHCNTCQAASQSPECTSSDGLFTVLKENYASLTHPSQEIMKLLQTCESVFNNSTKSLSQNRSVEAALFENVKPLEPCFNFPVCHELFDFVIRKYLTLRIHIYASYMSRMHRDKKAFASKSAFVRDNVR